MRILSKALIFAAATTALASAASAQVSVSATPGCAVYSDCGPTPVTYDFETPGTTPIFLGGAIVGPGTTDGQYAQPLGSTGLYFSAGPSTGGPPTNITIGNNISSFSLIWGSLDDYNTLILHTMVGDYTYTGLDIAALIPGLANGDQSAPNTNPIVTFMLSGLDQQAVSFNMLSTQNAFEIDNIAVNSVPEPATWAMMLFGFGACGMALRSRRRKLAIA